VTVAFTALSYRERLVVTVNADPDACPDVDRLAQALGDQLAGPAGPSVPGPPAHPALAAAPPAARRSAPVARGRGRSWRNRIVLGLLRSPVHRLVDDPLIGLRLRGVVTGRVHELPVMAARDVAGLVVLVGRSGSKRWWRNLRRRSAVQLLSGGTWQPASAEVLAPESVEWQRARETYTLRWPRVVVGAGDPWVRVRPGHGPSLAAPGDRT
jgi:hypothetical protein